MKDGVILLLCAVALAHGVDQDLNRQQCNCDPSEAQQICEANYGSDNVQIAHENCDKFYKCANGKPVAFTCQDNLLYDPVLEICNWPYQVDCGDRPISDGTESTDPDCDDNTGGDNDNGAENDNDGTCNCDPSEAPSICAAEDSNGVYVAHENCNQFYLCANGRPEALVCPEGLLFNPYKRECDWPQNVECGDRVIPEPDENPVTDNNIGGDDSDNNDGTCNCNPGEAPSICAAPDSEGVLVAHENCNQYYICNYGRPVALLCPNPLLFNPYTRQCDWRQNVDCGDRVVPEPKKNCPSCNEDDDSDDIDDLPLPDDDGNDIDDVPPQGDDAGNDSDDGNSPESDNGDNDNVGGGNCDPSEAPAICAAEDSDDVLVAHENCNKYYICDGGKPVARPCPTDLLFNPNTDQCDWPENVDCGDRVIPDPDNDDSGNDSGDSDNGNSDDGGSDNESSDNGGNDVVGGGNCDPSEAPAICAADDSDDVLVAHENCNKYYICHGGKPVARPCPNDLLFNPNTDQCDWPENVDCGDRVIPDPDDNDNGNDNGSSDNEGNDNGGTDNGGSDNDGNDNGGTCNCSPGEAPEICLADNSNGTLIAHENCDQYYICDHGKPVAMYCPENLLYNPYKEECDWPENVDCGDRNVPDSDDSDDLPPGGDDPGSDIDDLPPGGDDPGSDIDDLPPGGDDPGSDIDDLPPVGDDPGNDNDTPDCDNDNNDEPCNCRPEDAPSICAVGDSDGVYIAHENCNQYYQCSNGRPVALKCPAGLLYNPLTATCDWPHNVDCGDRVIPDPEEDNNVSESDEVDDGGNDNGGSCNCNPEEAPAICAAEGSSDVMIAHENCNQFYKCANGVPVAFKCSSNLLYNPYKEDCDWPENVECGNRVIPDPDDVNSDEGNDNDNGPGADDNQPINDDPSQAPSICADSDSDGVLVAHENCNQYYVCSTGQPVAMPCSTGLLFNPVIHDCDWPQNVDCGDRVIPDDDCACNPRNAPKLCSKQNSDGLLVAHEDCSQFYMCVAGVPTPRSCPEMLLFNADKTVCDWPQNVNCNSRILPFSSLNKHSESRQSLRK